MGINFKLLIQFILYFFLIISVTDLYSQNINNFQDTSDSQSTSDSQDQDTSDSQSTSDSQDASDSLYKIPDTEKLKIQKNLPRYRMDFNHRLVQKEVYDELIKEKEAESDQEVESLSKMESESK